MIRAAWLLLLLASCTAENPAATPTPMSVPPGLVRWCLAHDGAAISCFAWDGSICASWGCSEIPWYACPDEGSARWPFSCTDGPDGLGRTELALASR